MKWLELIKNRIKIYNKSIKNRQVLFCTSVLIELVLKYYEDTIVK